MIYAIPLAFPRLKIASLEKPLFPMACAWPKQKSFSLQKISDGCYIIIIQVV